MNPHHTPKTNFFPMRPRKYRRVTIITDDEQLINDIQTQYHFKSVTIESIPDAPTETVNMQV